MSSVPDAVAVRSLGGKWSLQSLLLQLVLDAVKAIARLIHIAVYQRFQAIIAQSARSLDARDAQRFVAPMDDDVDCRRPNDPEISLVR